MASRSVGQTKRRPHIIWRLRALAQAEYANTELFSSRRGVYGFDSDPTLLCVYNNNPYERFPTLRDEESAHLREWLAKEGIREVASAAYPTEGADAGYTTAMLIRSGRHRMDDVIAEMDRILELSHQRMAVARPS